jgi:hypothetical protein
MQVHVVVPEHMHGTGTTLMLSMLAYLKQTRSPKGYLYADLLGPVRRKKMIYSPQHRHQVVQ